MTAAVVSAVCVDCIKAAADGGTDAENGLSSGEGCRARTCDVCGAKGCESVVLDDCRDADLCPDCRPTYGCRSCPDCDPDTFSDRRRNR